MHHFLDRSKAVYQMSRTNAAVLTIAPGDCVTVQTEDCFGHRIISESQCVDEHFDFSRINPATGPIAVQNALPGDSLAITVTAIHLDSQGVVENAPGWGLLGKKATRCKTVIAEIRDNTVHFNGLSLPARPMIGVMGNAPEHDAVGCGTPGQHGGNLDTKEISEGAVVHLPVFVPGGLLALGDVHALMGDGESCGTGVECRATVELSIELAKSTRLSAPVVETDNEIIVISSHKELDQAIRESMDRAVRILIKLTGFPWQEAYMLASISCDVRISQLVNPLFTAKTIIPKHLNTNKLKLSQMNFEESGNE
ncbi:MAG TPA: acetamidase/formamidase [Kosmotogaceae bacterium]|nr:MAG: Acetamidase/Formamidase [Thermotogales bacterium 46_20]HAA85705.1 acetamidase/formamidase [Kosmotogaceae bacterium]